MASASRGCRVREEENVVGLILLGYAKKEIWRIGLKNGCYGHMSM